MADLMEVPSKYRRRMSQQMAELKAYEKWYARAWFAVCELVWLHKHGR